VYAIESGDNRHYLLALALEHVSQHDELVSSALQYVGIPELAIGKNSDVSGGLGLCSEWELAALPF
jgi:hypothetical protein